VPDLVDGRGRFRANMALAGAAMFFLPHVRGQMRAEVRAQFEAFRATGLKLDHVNAHKHFHLHPSILSAILYLAKEFRVPAVRAPFEPRAIRAQVQAADPRLSALPSRRGRSARV
jgi:chitin disaccharide deacetylase